MPRSLTEAEIDSFIDSKPGWIALTTVSPNGFPHTVPIGFFRIGNSIYCGCRVPTQKTRNIERNPKVSLMLSAGRTMGDIKGVLIQGLASVITDDGERLALSQTAARQRGVAEDALPQQATPGSAYIRVDQVKAISWDYSDPA